MIRLQGTGTTWEQVLDPATSPTGALFVVTPITAEISQAQTFVQGARLVAAEFVAPPGSGLREFGALDLDEGAVIALRGEYPGQAEGKFYWVGAARYGPDYILAGRLGGPISQAATLVPIYSHMLMTMELNPPAGGDDYHRAMVGYYTSAMGNTVVSSGWPD